MTTQNDSRSMRWFGRSWVWLLAGSLSLAVLPGANAQQPAQQQPAQAPLLGAAQEPNSSQQEVQQYCGSIVDPARDQRYLLQKQELDKLQADVNERIKSLEARKAEYQDWLKKRDDFLNKAKAGLVDIYKTSKPDAAAQQFNEMDIRIAAAIIMQLPARQSGLILSEMDPSKAAMVAGIMSGASNPKTSRDPS